MDELFVRIRGKLYPLSTSVDYADARHVMRRLRMESTRTLRREGRDIVEAGWNFWRL